MQIAPSPAVLLCAVLLGHAALSGSAGAQQTSEGHRLFGGLASHQTWLVDNAGAIVHTWPSNFNPGAGVYMLPDGSLLRAIFTSEPPGAAGGSGGGIQRMDLHGNLLWDWRYETPPYHAHHDIAPMPNGNVLVVAWVEKTNAEAVAAGRNPALLATYFRPDKVIEVQPTGFSTGSIVWEWHAWDHLVQDFDPSKANFGDVGANPGRIDINYPPHANLNHSWNHINGIDYDPVRDLVLVSARTQSEIWILDHSTTTAQAATSLGGQHGRGGEILYRWGNPQTYRAGGPTDQRIIHQHNPRFIPPGRPGAGNVTIFNNGTPGASEALEIELPLDSNGHFVYTPGLPYGPFAPVWTYTAPNFYSPIVSSVERLPNGNTLICSGTQNRVFEVAPSGQTLWTHQAAQTIFHAHYADRSLWASRDTLPVSAGGTVQFDLIAGSPKAQDAYILLASASGTSPGTQIGNFLLPLNIDETLAFSYDIANTPLFANSAGVLDSLGRATATLNIPPIPGSPLAGVQLHFAFGTYDPLTLQFTHGSNAVPLLFTP